jgi:hypothetical protein
MEQKHLSQQNVAISTGSGSPIGLFESSYTGQIYRDTSVQLNNLWMSVGHPSNTLWVPISGIPDSLIHYSEKSGTLNSRTNYLVKRTVVTGLKATFEILITTDGRVPINISDVIPLNFLSKKYFKMNRYTSIIKRISTHTTAIPMTGTYSTVVVGGSTMTTVVGVGTLFLSEFHIGDRITTGTGLGPYGSGYVASIESDTGMTLHWNTVGVVASNDPVYIMFGMGIEGFTRVDFNDLLNTANFFPSNSDLNNKSGFVIAGGSVGQLCQFEGSMGAYKAMPEDDDPILDASDFTYSTNYAPKDLTLAALNMEYNPRENQAGGAVNANNSWLANHENPGGTSDGEFHVVLEGYLL